MNKKIHEQVLKEVKKYIPLENAPMEYSQKNVEKAISRTQELIEEDLRCFVCTKKLKLTDYKCCSSCAISYLDEQKADFQKMIEELPRWDETMLKGTPAMKFKPNKGYFVNYYDILAKLGDNHSPKSSGLVHIPPSKDKPDAVASQIARQSSGFSKGCGKEINPYKKIKMPCGDIAGGKPLYCEECEEKTNTCICGHDKKEHDKKGRCHYDFGDKEGRCDCKKFQEVGK